MISNGNGRWRYEYTAVLIHFFIWGFVALDRIAISFLFPLMLPELKMGFTEAGLVMSIVGLTWAAGGLIFGTFSDKYGRKTVIIPATIAFSILSWMSGLSRNFGQLLAIRAVLGLPEGAYYAAGTATIAEVSTPKRRGLMIGIHHSAWAIIGALLGPIYMVAVATAWGWRWALYLTVIPGIIIAIIHWRFIREPASTEARIKARKEGRAHEVRSETGETLGWKDVLGHRNVIISSLISITIMTWFWIWVSFGAVFVTDFRKVPFLDTGFVLAAFGLGGAAGYIGLTALSDVIGRRPALSIAAAVTALATYGMALVGPDPLALTICIFLMGLAGFGLFSLTVGVVAAEAVPFAMAGLSIAIVTGVGEFFGAVIMPTVGGMLADAYGLQVPMLVSATGAVAAALLGLGLTETAPEKVAAKAPAVIVEPEAA
ncbi:MAG TPA: MFS transporter [Dehalococcoidia bacterium]|nr:MFS transporter [Dehalococcoidia bacterium]